MSLLRPLALSLALLAGAAGGGAPVTPVDGIFTVALDFGTTPWTNNVSRWLRVEVRPHDPTNTAPYTDLPPRQQVMGTPLSVYSQNTRGLTVDSSNRVGLGVSLPSERLDVNGNVYVNGEGKGVIVDAQSLKRVGFMNYAGYGTGVWRGDGVDFEFGRVNGVNVANGTPSAIDMYIAGDGNVGIGTTTTPSKLTVNGVIESTTGGIKFPDGSVQTSSLYPILGNLAVNGTLNGAAGVVVKSGGGAQTGFASWNTSVFNPVPGTTTNVGVLPPGKAMVNWSMTCYSTTGNVRIEVVPQIGGVSGPATQFYFNVGAEHTTISGTAMMDLTSTDPVNFRLQWRSLNGTVQVDVNDSFSWTLVDHRN